MSGLSYKACPFCEAPHLFAALQTHLNTSHLTTVSALAEASNTPIPDYIQSLLLLAQDADNGPIANTNTVAPPVLPYNSMTAAGVTFDSFVSANPVVSGAGNFVKLDELQKAISYIGSQQSIAIDLASAYLSLAYIAVLTQASQRSEDLGTFVMKSLPVTVAGSNYATAVAQNITNYPMSKFLAEIKNWFKINGREAITFRAIARSLYPILLSQRRNTIFQQFESEGTGATQMMGCGAANWPFLLTFANPELMTQAQRQLFASWIKCQKPVDSVSDDQTEPIVLPTLRDAAARSQFDDLTVRSTLSRRHPPSYEAE